MSQLTPEKLAEVAALLEKTSPQMAARLVTMFERVKVKGNQAIPTEALLTAVRESGLGLPARLERVPGFDRLFFEPFEHLFEPHDAEGGPLPGFLPRAGLKQVWEILSDEIAPDLHDRFEPVVKAAVLRGAMDHARNVVAEFRDRLVDMLDQPGEPARWSKALSACPEGAFSRRLPALLLAEHLARPDIATARTQPRDLPDAVVAALSETLRVIEARSGDAALELVLLVMGHLHKPWQALRILAGASKGVTDRKLALTEFQTIGDRLLAMAAREKALFDIAARGGPFGSAALVRAVERFGDLVNGMLREQVLDRDGPWRKALQALQTTAAARLEAVCQRAVAMAGQGLPVDRIRLKGAGLVDRPRHKAPLRMERLDALPAHLTFLRDVRLFASAAGFAAARDQAARAVQLHLDTVRDGLIAVRADPDRGPHHAQWVQAVSTYIEALEGEDSARLFERRAAA